MKVQQKTREKLEKDWGEAAPRFMFSYQRMVVAFPPHKIDDIEMIVFSDSLCHLPIEAVEKAEQTLRRLNLTNGYFPSAPKWAEVAERFARTIPRQAPQPVPLTPAETKQLTKVRAGFLASLRVRGEQAWAVVADRLEKMLKIPRALPPVACEVCGDSGFAKHTWPDVISGELVLGVTPCACRQTNTVILARIAEARLALDQGSVVEQRSAQQQLTEGQ